MSDYKTIAESKNFIVLDKYTPEWKAAEGYQTEDGGCAEFCVNGQSTAGASRPVRKHYEHQETRRPRRTAV